MSRVYVFLADGFEEIEGLTVVDLLRRAGIETEMVSIMGRKNVQGSHGIEIMADGLFEAHDYRDAQMLVLPGGMPGTKHLGAHEGLRGLLEEHYQKGTMLAAICAAPSVLGNLGFLKDKMAVCYPGFEDQLLGAKVCQENVAVDGNVITSRGMGTAIDFSLKLVEKLKDLKTAEGLAEGIIYKNA